MKQYFDRTMFRGVVVAGVVTFMGALASTTVAQVSTVDVNVNIEFDAAGCPQSVDLDDFFVDKAKRVIWQSVDADGNIFDQSYEIYFDPFKGQPLRSDNKGRRKSPPFDTGAPATAEGIQYKYSIVGDNCKHAPYDPRFRLR
jgi:hypothetical protein